MAVETVMERTNVHKLLERITDVLPGGDEWDQEAGLLDPTTSSRCCGSARSTCSAASRAGSSAASTPG